MAKPCGSRTSRLTRFWAQFSRFKFHAIFRASRGEKRGQISHRLSPVRDCEFAYGWNRETSNPFHVQHINFTTACARILDTKSAKRGNAEMPFCLHSSLSFLSFRHSKVCGLENWCARPRRLRSCLRLPWIRSRCYLRNQPTIAASSFAALQTRQRCRQPESPVPHGSGPFRLHPD